MSSGPTTPEDLGRAPVRTATATASSPGATVEAVPSRGDALDRYVVVEQIGAGGMGTVFRAYDPELDRFVAIKLVAADRVHLSEERQRILREARVSARLTHPNVVRVYDVGEWHGAVFIVMELVPGTTVGDWCQSERRSASHVLQVFRAAGEGLCAAHDAGLVHRDIKPRNILMGDDGRICVADFGLARAFGARRDDQANIDLPESLYGSPTETDTVTRDGVIVGSPAYMAPEQQRGGESDARSDQFSFCVSLYEALRGHRPPRGEGGQVRVDSQRWPGVPRRVRRAVLRGLHASPAERFPSMRALLEQLAPRRRGAVAIALAGGIAIAGVVTSVALTYSGKPPTICSNLEAPIAEAWNPRVQRRVTASFAGSGHGDAAAITEQLFMLVDERTAQWGESRTAVCRATARGTYSRALSDRRMLCYDRELARLETFITIWSKASAPLQVENAVPRFLRSFRRDACSAEELLATPQRPRSPAAKEVMALVDEADARRALLQYDEANALADKAVAAARQLDNDLLLGDALFCKAQVLQSMEQSEESANLLLEAAGYAGAAGDDRMLARIVSDLVFLVSDRLRHYDEGIRLGRLGEALVKRAGNDPRLRAQLHSDLGVALQHADRLQESERHLRAALTSERSRVDQNPYELANALNRLGNTLLYAGQVTEAEALFREGVTLLQEFDGRSTRLSRSGVNNLATAYAERGDRTHAIEMWRTIEAEELASYGEFSLQLVYPYVNLTGAYIDTEQYDLALRYADRVVTLYEHAGMPDHPNIAYGLTARAAASLARRQPEAAVAELQRAEELLRRANDSPSDELAQLRSLRGESLLQLGDAPGAEVEFRAALAIHEQLGTAAWQRAEVHFGLGRVLWVRGKHQEASELAEQAAAALATAPVVVPLLPARISTWLASHGLAVPQR